MAELMLAWSFPLAVGICVCLVVALGWHAVGAVGRAGRLPLPAQVPQGLRLIWWPVSLFAHGCSRGLSRRTRLNLERRLSQAGLSHLLRAEHLAGAQLFAATVAATLVSCGLAFAGATPGVAAWVPVLVGAALAGAGMPLLWLRDRIQSRRRAVVRALPFFLDMTTLCVEAGLNFAGALQQATERGPAGPLREELQRVMGDVRTGVPRAQALRDMADRLNEPAVHTLVTTLVQAEALGMSLSRTLRAQSDQRRAERFHKAEKLAMEAPVKMLFPLIAFIFPCTFIVIAFPIAMKLLELV